MNNKDLAVHKLKGTHNWINISGYAVNSATGMGYSTYMGSSVQNVTYSGIGGQGGGGISGKSIGGGGGAGGGVYFSAPMSTSYISSNYVTSNPNDTFKCSVCNEERKGYQFNNET